MPQRRRFIQGDRVLTAAHGAGTVSDADARDPQRWIEVDWDQTISNAPRHLTDPHNGKVVWEASDADIEAALAKFEAS